MAPTAELRLNLPVDQARNAVASALTEQRFTVLVSPSGGLDVSRGSLGTTLVAGAFAGQDMHVRFDVHLAATESGTRAEFEHSSVGGFLKGGAIGAAKADDAVREAAHFAGLRLAEQGLLEGSAPVAVLAGAEPAYVTGAAAPAGATAGADTGAQYGAGAAVPPPIDYANRTNVVSIVALILGFIFPIGGIIAGAVGLAQTKRTGEKGRGLALAGIIIGSIMIVLTIIAVIALFAFAAFTSSQISEDELLLPPSSDSDVPADDIPAEESESVDVFTVQLGDCLGATAESEVSNVELVDCAAPHDYEVYTEFDISGDVFPGDAAINQAADDGCYQAFAGFIGVAWEESLLDYSYLVPTQESWTEGADRTVVCLAVDPDAQTVGTLAGAAR